MNTLKPQAWRIEDSVVLASKLRLFRLCKARRPFNLKMGNELPPAFFGRQIQIYVRKPRE